MSVAQFKNDVLGEQQIAKNEFLFRSLLLLCFNLSGRKIKSFLFAHVMEIFDLRVR